MTSLLLYERFLFEKILFQQCLVSASLLAHYLSSFGEDPFAGCRCSRHVEKPFGRTVQLKVDCGSGPPVSDPVLSREVELRQVKLHLRLS